MEELPWEDGLLERKVGSDLKDLLKTLVAFANSVRPDHTAVILIGEKDDGTAQGVQNPDEIQRTVRKQCEKIYPPIAWRSRIYEKEGKPCVRVEIEYDGATPHFGGIAWVRRGSDTLPASDDVFQRLIEFRLGKVRELAKWLRKEVTVEGDSGSVSYQERSIRGHLRWQGEHSAILCHVNTYWATFQVTSGPRNVGSYSEPLEKLFLTWDDRGARLKLLVKL
ncbi:MAG: ATP-binding protein [Acidobacteria bacterium]|nr:ATP-binding protein [Acidobacteriota bacterium]